MGRADDADRDVGFVALVSEDLDTQGRAIQHGGVFPAVQQRLAYEPVHRRSERALSAHR